MICKCCGEVKPDWGSKKYCRECWEEMFESRAEDYRDLRVRDEDKYKEDQC